MLYNSLMKSRFGIPPIILMARSMVAQDPTILLGLWAEAKAKGDEDGAQSLELLFGLPGESDEDRQRAIETAKQVNGFFEGASKLPGPEHK